MVASLCRWTGGIPFARATVKPSTGSAAIARAQVERSFTGRCCRLNRVLPATDATHAQLQSITKMQIQMIDQMMDIWEEQIKSPNPITASSAMLSKLKSLPGAGPAGTWPNADAFAE